MQNQITSQHGPEELIPKLRGKDCHYLIKDEHDQKFIKEKKYNLRQLDVNQEELMQLHKDVHEKYLKYVNDKIKEIRDESASENQIIQDFANSIKRSSSDFSKLVWD